MLKEVQSEFRKGRSVQDHIFTVKRVIEKVLSSKSKVYVAFTELKKGFYRVQQQKV